MTVARPGSIPNALQDDRYLLLGSLGRGGMATVFRAFDGVEQRLVALKVQHDDGAAGPAHPLSSEFDIWSRLDHPNVVRAYGLGVARRGPLDDGIPYLVLEHVDGGPLHRRFANGGIRADTLERIAIDVLRGLHHVHASGLVHRDLKPANVLIEDDPPSAKLTDFGLALPCGDCETPGVVSGSLPYVAPESLLGRPLDCRTDLYSLGVLLYRLATGRMPGPPHDVEALLRWHLAGAPADPQLVRPRFPSRLARFIRRLTERDPGARPRDAAAALELLGARPTPGAAGSGCAGLAERGRRARLRLALDAVRLGARRRFVLPHDTGAALSLVRQARVWSYTHGLTLLDLQAGVERAVLTLLLDARQGPVATRLRRHGLERWLPLGSLAGVPLLDHDRASPDGGPEAARAVTAFLLDAAVAAPLVVLGARGAGATRLAAAVTLELDRGLAPIQDAPNAARRGGLLLLRPPATARDSSNPVA